MTCGKLPFAIILLAVRPSGSVPTDDNNGLRVLLCARVLLYTATDDIVVCVVLASGVGNGVFLWFVCLFCFVLIVCSFVFVLLFVVVFVVC